MEKKFVYVPSSERKRSSEPSDGSRETKPRGGGLASTLRYLNSNPQTNNSRTPFKICYSSDLHGNIEHYRLLVQAAEEHKCDYIFIGGDLHPKRKGAINKYIR